MLRLNELTMEWFKFVDLKMKPWSKGKKGIYSPAHFPFFPKHFWHFSYSNLNMVLKPLTNRVNFHDLIFKFYFYELFNFFKFFKVQNKQNSRKLLLIDIHWNFKRFELFYIWFIILMYHFAFLNVVFYYLIH